MSAQRYVDEVVGPPVLSFLRKLEDPLLQQDNARSHILRRSMNCFTEANVNTLR